MQVTPAIAEHAQGKLSHAMETYRNAISSVDVRISARGGDAGKGVKCVPSCHIAFVLRRCPRCQHQRGQHRAGPHRQGQHACSCTGIAA